jgi:hypothetical protein
MDVPDLEPPEVAQATEEPGVNQDSKEFVSAFSNKRLCESLFPCRCEFHSIGLEWTRWISESSGSPRGYRAEYGQERAGWDELLKTRSVVFVMEEEYRLHKTSASVDLNGQDDNASTTAMRSPAPDRTQPDTPAEIPTIRISSESTRGQSKSYAVGTPLPSRRLQNGF